MENREYQERLRLFGFRLSCLLSERRMAQVDLSKRLGLADNTVSKYTLAISFPNVYRLIEIAKIFDVSTDYLTGLTDDRKGIYKGENAEFRQEEPAVVKKRVRVQKKEIERRGFCETRKRKANRVHIRGHHRGGRL